MPKTAREPALKPAKIAADYPPAGPLGDLIANAEALSCTLSGGAAG